jgi:hypothetical protein
LPRELGSQIVRIPGPTGEAISCPSPIVYNESMPTTIDITNELESRIRQRAAQQGVGVAEYVRRTLQEHRRGAEISETRHLSGEESRLVREIKLGLPEATCNRYRELIQSP